MVLCCMSFNAKFRVRSRGKVQLVTCKGYMRNIRLVRKVSGNQISRFLSEAG